jgi:hypothetical protein
MDALSDLKYTALLAACMLCMYLWIYQNDSTMNWDTPDGEESESNALTTQGDCDDADLENIPTQTIETIMNTNGVIYRQQQRSLRHLSQISKQRKDIESRRVVDEIMQKQDYIKRHSVDIKKALLEESLRKAFAKSTVNASLRGEHILNAIQLSRDLGYTDLEMRLRDSMPRQAT